MTDENLPNQGITLSSIQSRIFAFLIDDFLISILFMIILYNQILNAKSFEEIIILINSHLMPMIALKIVYQSFFVWFYGASLGKIMLKIKVIDINGFKPSFSVSFLRACGRIISEWIFFLGFVLGLFDKNRQTLHDKIAKTMVINA